MSNHQSPGDSSLKALNLLETGDLYPPYVQEPGGKLPVVRVENTIHLGDYTVLAVAEPSVHIQMDVTKANPGDNVFIMCDVRDQGEATITMVKQFKAVRDEVAYNEVLFIGNTLLNAPESTGRYSLIVVPVGDNKKLYKLDIANVTADDSGPYTCSLLGLDIYKTKEFFVYNPIHEMKFQNITVDHSYSVIVANETTPLDVECIAKGSIPAADITMFIGEEDITRHFRMTTSINRVCPGGSITADIKDCLTHDTFNTNAFTANFQPTYKHHNQNLRCVALVKGAQFPAREVISKVRMQFGPKFDCRSTVLGRLHESEYKVMCNIMSNPANPDFVWEFTWGGRTEKLSNNEATSDGELIAGQTIMPNDSMEVWLKIKKISMRHFATFTLKSNNSMGSHEMVIELKQDKTANAAQKVVATSMGLLLVLLRALL